MTMRVFIALTIAIGLLSCSGGATLHSGGPERELMSVATLLERAEDFHEFNVVVTGFLTLEWESCVLWQDRIAFEQENTALALWVNIANGACFDVHMHDVHVARDAVIGGTFSATDMGHLFLFGGTIRNPELVAPNDPVLDAMLRGQ